MLSLIEGKMKPHLNAGVMLHGKSVITLTLSGPLSPISDSAADQETIIPTQLYL